MLVHLSRLALLGLLLAQGAAARPYVVCVLEQEFVPRAADEAPQSGQAIVRQALASLGDSVTYIGAPWRRCLAGVRGEQFDGVLGAAANPSFMPFMRFPMKQGQPDTSAALASTAHVVLRRAGTRSDWDGKRFTQREGAVFYPSGTAIVGEKLAQLDVPGNDSAKTALQLMRMLQHGRCALLVLRKTEAEALLAGPEFAGLEILAQPFVVGHAYLGLRRTLQEADPLHAAAIWGQIATAVRQRGARSAP